MSRTVVDADAHYFEPLSEFHRYVDEPWKSRLGPDGDTNALLPGITGTRSVWGRIDRYEVPSYHDSKEGHLPPEEIPTVMEHVGVDKIILLSQLLLKLPRLSGEDERPVVLANAYMDYMLEKAVDPDEGIYTAIPVPFQDPDASVELIKRVADERAVVAACLITAGPVPPLGNRKYDVIYEAAEKAGLPLIFHSTGSNLDDFLVDGYEKFLETHTLGFLWGNMSQVTSLIVQGVPEKFPDLEFVFQESGIFWVPMMMFRLDAEYLKRRSEAPLLTKLPSEYMREFYYGTQPLEKPDPKYLESVIEMIGGPDRLIYASDYPHWDYDRVEAITDIPFLSEEEKDRILGGNAEQVFDI